ncbi:hypothetical protein P9272_02825 [Mesorhizobium sp. WSM4976]|uniref:hypothetical protein n=1 Tax=Mesorhizobium sp. WSM4976 TaxID=3038549 RepID=UPI002415E9B0|nr:hypothetical protein [Mesorhizobium sp. WSM4976]MDG4892530.1 hypothetical protein [Mesorhizobium sp. WSM4976]
MFGVTQADQMVDGVAALEQIVGYDGELAPPPDCLQAYQGQATGAAEMDQFFKGDGKFRAQNSARARSR